MATINAGNLTLLDHAKRTDPNGQVSSIVEMLTQRNSLLQDAVFKEGNLPTGHRVTSRTGLPAVGWRRFNEGVPAGKSRTDQYDETCGQLEGTSIVDAELSKLYGNQAAYRASEDMAFVQSMANEVETGMFYHSTYTNPERFLGLAPRFASSTGTGGSQILRADQLGGSSSGSDQNSIWLITWGDDACYGILPKGSQAGIQMKDMGEQLITDGSGNRFRAFVTNWNWKVGLVVHDYRKVVRIANIDTSASSATGSLIIQLMIRAWNQIFNPGTGKLVFYVNRTVATLLHLQAMDTVKNSTLQIENIGGQRVLTFLGVPVRTTDALLNTEAIVT